MQKVHELKTVQPYFDRVWELTKLFEVRKNDRDFQSGDGVILREYSPETNSYSNRMINGTILYVLTNFEGVKEGYVVFSVEVNSFVS
jgi:hypothetical protein